MANLIIRKLLLITLLVPLLHVLSFYYVNGHGPSQLRRQYGNLLPEREIRPFEPRYRSYLGGLARGDLGAVQHVPVTTYVVQPIWNSVILFGIALGLGSLFGPLLGVLVVSPRTGRINSLGQMVFTVGSSVPGFFLGTVLITLIVYFARNVWIGRGMPIPMQGFGLDAHLILPVLTLASRLIFFVAGITAALLEDEMQQEYVRVARSKGLSDRLALLHHALPNIAAPILVTLGQMIPVFLGGLILIEALFDWRGIGWLFLKTIAVNPTGNTSPIYMSVELVPLIIVGFMLLLLLADLLTGLAAYAVDPRVREAGQTQRAL